MKKLTQEYYSEITILRVKNYRLRNINEELNIATNGYMKFIRNHYYPLKEKNEKLRQFVAKVARIMYARNGENVDASIFGYSLREMLGENWREIVTGECTE